MNTIPKKNQTFVVKLAKEDYANLFSIAHDGEYYFFNISNSLYIKDFNNIAPAYFSYYTVKAGDTWTNLSFQIYGTIELWWTICKANDILNPMEMPEEGKKLKILNSQVTAQILSQIKS